MKGKVITKEFRWRRHLKGILRNIGVYTRKQARRGLNYSQEISVLSGQAESLKFKLNQAGK